MFRRNRKSDRFGLGAVISARGDIAEAEMRKILVGLIGAMLAAFGGNALGADLYTPPPAESYAPTEPAAWSWTGLYFGGGGGFDWADFSNIHATYFDGVEVTDYPGERLYGADLAPTGAFGTVTAGLDWQAGSHFVVGLFGSYDFQDKTDDLLNPIAFVGDPTNDFEGQAFNVALGDITTIAARAGVLVTPHALIYGLAGYSFGDATLGYFEGCTPNACSNLAYQTTASVGGWTLGAGFEWLMARWISARIEYRYTDFGSFIAFGNDGIVDSFSGFDTTSVTDQSIRAVLTFRLPMGG
jgi:outer membrane immunogenic protein